MTGDRVRDDANQTSLRVIEAVADRRGTEPSELEPLYGSIDPDGLDSLFPADEGTGEPTGPELAFTFAEHRVMVSSDGSIDVTPASRPGEPFQQRGSDTPDP